MKLSHLTLLSILSLCSSLLSSAQQADEKKEQGVTTDITVIVPPAVSHSAMLAVQKLGDKVRQGDYQYAYDTLYSRFKKRQEAHHGKDKLKQVILGARDQLLQSGIRIDSLQASRPTGFFRVWPEIKPEIKAKLASGELQQTKPGDEVYHWMVIVPTKQKLAFLGQGGGRTRYAMVEEYQIAIAKEASVPGQEKWTFISPVKEQQLRAIFPSLPVKLKLPVLKKYEVPK